MIDLRPILREYLLRDTEFSSRLSNYLDSKALFTRTPVPNDANYPLGVISPIVADLQNDFVSCGGRRTLSIDVFVYSNNEDATSYRNVEAAGLRLVKLLHRIPRYELSLPTGFSLIQTTAIGPLPGPTNDLIKVARAVTVNIDLYLENV